MRYLARVFLIALSLLASTLLYSGDAQAEKIHTAGSFLELYKAIDLAKSGDIIEITEDIPIHNRLITKKKITIRSASGGAVHTLYREDDYEGNMLGTVGKKATIILENIIVDGGKDRFDTPVSAILWLYSGGTAYINENAILQNNYGYALDIQPKSKAILNGGIIRNNDSLLFSGVIVCGDFTMISGEITENRASESGGVTVYGTFTMKGGTISNNVAHDQGGGGITVNGGQFNMQGGSITGNSGNLAGGIMIVGGKMTITDGDISNNFGSKTGGIYLDGWRDEWSSSLQMKGGSIHNNMAGSFSGAGGVAINADYYGNDKASRKPIAVFTMTGGSIEDNQTGSALMRYGDSIRLAAGGVVVLGCDAGFNFKGGVIQNNVSPANQIGIYAEAGTFSISAEAELGKENQLYLAESCKATIAKEQLDKISMTINK